MAYEEQREKSRRMMQLSGSLIDLVLGLLMVAVGVIIIKENHFKIPQIVKFVEDRDALLIKIFGYVTLVYGLWRLYRAYVKIKDN